MNESLKALCAAYAKFADIHCDWPGRHTLDGQRLLSTMRDAIAHDLKVEPQDVQDTLAFSKEQS